ncbi:MAG: hypothetical protein HRT89_16345 [Lentisphaeria bacterium]|nr:hypothetical protein [Lentisphaeria bacterium]NQZ69630.1 hypothetical protein [Lentisphaeria bacterium]
MSDFCIDPPVPKPEDTVARCTLCSKPLSAENIFQKEGSNFCSVSAAAQYEIQADYRTTVDARERVRKRKAFVRKIMILIVIGLLGAAAYYYSEQQKALKKDKGKKKQKTEYIQTRLI